MKGVEGTYLNAPIGQRLSGALSTLFTQEEKRCNQIATQLINEAKDKGIDFKNKMMDNKEVMRYYDCLEFFAK